MNFLKLLGVRIGILDVLVKISEYDGGFWGLLELVMQYVYYWMSALVLAVDWYSRCVGMAVAINKNTATPKVLSVVFFCMAHPYELKKVVETLETSTHIK